MKIKLFVDFDGVILNTIDISYQEIKKKFGLNATTDDSIKFYQELDWNDFLHQCEPINHSLEDLNKIIESELYDVTILTHILSPQEQEAKRKYLEEYLPEAKYIPVIKPNPKWKMVDCQNAILVDDFSENLLLWQEHGGFSIKFSLKDKKYDFYSISKLEELLNQYPKISKLVLTTPSHSSKLK